MSATDISASFLHWVLSTPTACDWREQKHSKSVMANHWHVLLWCWKSTNETMLYCQIWRGIRLCCCYWHIFPSLREKERTTLKYNNLNLFNSLLLARPWRSLISSSVGQTVSSPGCCCRVLTWLILIQHWGCQKISLTTEEHKIRNKLLICLYYPHSVA